MRHVKLVTLVLFALAACGEDVSLGAQDAMSDGDIPDGGGMCAVEAGAALPLQCGNVMCNGASEYCSTSTWPEPCKPLPCECAALPGNADACACLLEHITPDCDAGTMCTNGPSGLVITCQ